MNITIFQFFHWYYPDDGKLWQHAKEEASKLASLGITHVWLPPAYKSGCGTGEPGYAVYDLYDLGEFDQKGCTRTKYGTRDEYLECIKSIQNAGMQVIADIVLNHKHGADATEKVTVQPVHCENRLECAGEKATIDAHTVFNFPGRNKKYSAFEWNWQCFTGIDGGPDSIYLILNEYSNGQWDELVEEEKGNFDYLMGADIEFRNPYVKEELKRWGEWYISTTGVDALRLDAVKHISTHFFIEWLDHIRSHFNRDFFVIGEYWRNEVFHLLKYLDAVDGRLQLFDVPLHYNFHLASMDPHYDMGGIFNGTLVKERPHLAITFVDNHDTQPLQSLHSPVDYWFKPHCYAMILLREQGIPCVFYPSIYEAKYTDHKDGQDIYVELHGVPCVPVMLKVRKHLAYGEQRDYFDHGNTIGWIREGVDDKPHSGCAIVLTNSMAGDKEMLIGERHKGRTFINVCGDRSQKITISENGMARFYTGDRSVSVWIDEEALQFFPS